MEAGEAGLGDTPTQNVDGDSRTTLPIRYLSRRWLQSWSRRNPSSAETPRRLETSPRSLLANDRPLLANDRRLNRLPSYGFLFRAPPRQETPRGATTTTTEGARSEPPAPQTKAQGPKRSLSTYLSESSTGEAAALEKGQSTKKKKQTPRPTMDDKPRPRRELPQYVSRRSLAPWRRAPPPEYFSFEAVRRESLPPPEYVSMRNVMSNTSSVVGSSSSVEVTIIFMLHTPPVASRHGFEFVVSLLCRR